MPLSPGKPGSPALFEQPRQSGDVVAFVGCPLSSCALCSLRTKPELLGDRLRRVGYRRAVNRQDRKRGLGPDAAVRRHVVQRCVRPIAGPTAAAHDDADQFASQVLGGIVLASQLDGQVPCIDGRIRVGRQAPAERSQLLGLSRAHVSWVGRSARAVPWTQRRMRGSCSHPAPPPEGLQPSKIIFVVRARAPERAIVVEQAVVHRALAVVRRCGRRRGCRRRSHRLLGREGCRCRRLGLEAATPRLLLRTPLAPTGRPAFAGARRVVTLIIPCRGRADARPQATPLRRRACILLIIILRERTKARVRANALIDGGLELGKVGVVSLRHASPRALLHRSYGTAHNGLSTFLELLQMLSFPLPYAPGAAVLCDLKPRGVLEQLVQEVIVGVGRHFV
mmetsp:Transcript_76430/g.218900  ORF Transcript_76430/g.218900 Transcript_76430/m.218900 type:complete len:394 (+) Transcript_76430:794-1975(+)